jgi:hypothetical protein
MRMGNCAVWLVALCLGLAACGTPITVERVDAHSVQTELTSNVLSTGRLSGATQIVLHQEDLEKLYATAPAQGIAALHRIVAAGGGWTECAVCFGRDGISGGGAHG